MLFLDGFVGVLALGLGGQGLLDHVGVCIGIGVDVVLLDRWERVHPPALRGEAAEVTLARVGILKWLEPSLTLANGTLYLDHASPGFSKLASGRPLVIHSVAG